MSDIEFIQLGRDVLREMQYINVNSKGFRNLCDKMKKIKLHIMQNPDNKFVNDFIEELINHYAQLFFNKELMEAFYIKEPFYRQIQIYKNLPSTIQPAYGAYLFNLLELSSFPHFYPGFLEALEKYKPEWAKHPHLQQLLGFVEQNQNIMRGSSDEYGSIEEEKALYRRAYKGEYFKELETFAFLNNIMGQNEARSSFMNKRIGNIGELYTYEFIKDKNRNCLVAREAKNGFGYDLYYLDERLGETLIEVKTTLRDTEEDSFSLSENEYRVMQQCENNPLANYIVCRIKLDNSFNLISYTFLIMVDSTTFIDATSGIQYRRDPNDKRITFKKCTPKVKMMTQENI